MASLRRSDIETFLECRQLWNYVSRRGHDLEVPTLNKHTFLGSAIHYALAEFYKPRPPGESVPNPVDTMSAWGVAEMAKSIEAGWDVDTDELMAALVLGRTMMTGYLEHWGNHPDNDSDGLRFLGTEIQFEVEIPGTDGGKLSGTADGLVIDRDGRYLVFETKTYTGSPPGNFHLNFQTLAYAWAFDTMAKEGHPLFESTPNARVSGSVYNGLRKQEPGPRVTKALFVRERVFRSRAELDTFAGYLSDIYREMTNPNVAIYPTITRNCEWCPFAEPCYARLTGADEQWILDAWFTRHLRVQEPTPES